MMARSVGQRLAGNSALLILSVTLTIFAFTGGSARYSMLGLSVVRPVAALALGVLVCLPKPMGERLWTTPMVLLCLLFVWLTLQLVPLPVSIWPHIPNHRGYEDVAFLNGVSQPWRPISIVPILTLNSMMALLPPLAMLVALYYFPKRQLGLVVLMIIVVAAVSILVGLFQISEGPTSSAYFYGGAEAGVPSGLMANRNHEAVFLAAVLPLLAAWAVAESRDRFRFIRRAGLSMVFALVIIVSVMISGSRSGGALTAVGILFAAWIIGISGVAGDRYLRSDYSGILKRLRIAGAVVFVGLSVALVPLALGRQAVFNRLTLDDSSGVARLAALPVTLTLARDFLPLGSGFGTFDPVFRASEPDSLLKPSYFNNAHNDLIELVITGGVPGFFLLVAFLIWMLRVGWRLIAQGSTLDRIDRLYGHGALFFLLILLAGSLSDYPLRTALLASLFALGCGILGRTTARSGVVAP